MGPTVALLYDPHHRVRILQANGIGPTSKAPKVLLPRLILMSASYTTLCISLGGSLLGT